MNMIALAAALKIAQSFLDIPLVKRLLQNAAEGTTNKIDDWVVDILYGASEVKAAPEEVKAKLEVVQDKLDTMTPEAKAEAKTVTTTLTADQVRELMAG